MSKLCGTIYLYNQLKLIQLLQQDLTEFGALFRIVPLHHCWICIAPALLAWIGSYSMLVAIVACMLAYCLCPRQYWLAVFNIQAGKNTWD